MRIESELAGGVRDPKRRASTVSQLAKAFLLDYQGLVKAGKREQTSLDQKDQHVRLHLEPSALSRMEVGHVSGPDCVAYVRDLEQNLSDALARAVYATVKMIFAFAKQHGFTVNDPATGIGVRTGSHGYNIDAADETEIPPKDQLTALWHAAQETDDKGRTAAAVALGLFAGLRSSEIRGYPLKHLPAPGDNFPTLKIRQRADRYNQIGKPKTKKGRRNLPLAEEARLAVNRWRLKCPKGPEANIDGLLFPGRDGHAISYSDFQRNIWWPVMEKAGLADVEYRIYKSDRQGMPPHKVIKPWFRFHDLRHAAVSAWIELGTAPKVIMEWAGHSSITMTYDLYGHLWDDPDQARIIMAGLTNMYKKVD